MPSPLGPEDGTAEVRPRSALGRLLASVRARLMGLILIGAIPVTVLLAQGALNLYDEARSAARERVVLIREAAAARHQLVIEGAEQILMALSRFFELKAGDLVFTGTPAGVGPLRRGDRVAVRIGPLAPLEFEIAT